MCIWLGVLTQISQDYTVLCAINNLVHAVLVPRTPPATRYSIQLQMIQNNAQINTPEPNTPQQCHLLPHTLSGWR